ncbi:hypothetical protein JCM8547_000860 [Rhodosporidiobolus lusitaniae]
MSSFAPSTVPPPAILLSPIPSPGSDDKPTPLSAKDSLLSSFPGEPVIPNPHRRRWRWLTDSLPTWGQVETVFWAAVPLFIHVVPIILVCVALFSTNQSRTFMTMKEVDGTGRLDWYILSSCVTAPNTNSYTCTSPSMYVDYAPSVAPLLSTLPGVSAFKLPQHEYQTPIIFTTSLVLLICALIVYLPLWILAYYPYARLPAPLVRFYRYFARSLYYVVGTLSFSGFLCLMTIGVGHKLWLMTFARRFETYYKFGVYSTGSNFLRWELHLGTGFDLVWAASAISCLGIIAVNIAMHNGMDEVVMWGPERKR